MQVSDFVRVEFVVHTMLTNTFSRTRRMRTHHPAGHLRRGHCAGTERCGGDEDVGEEGVVGDNEDSGAALAAGGSSLGSGSMVVWWGW